MIDWREQTNAYTLCREYGFRPGSGCTLPRKTKRRPDIPWMFFMAMGIGVHGAIILANPQVYMGFGNGALIPLYRELSLRVIAALSPVLFGLLVAAFELLWD
jgi:hypothetical protein